MPNNIHDLAKKIKALADRGVGGEKYNAQKKLEALLKKHGITLEDISEEKKTDRVFRFRHDTQKLFMHIIYFVCGYSEIMSQTIYVHKKYPKTSLIIACTDVQYLEILALKELYCTAWYKELDIFTSAFIQQNDLAITGDVTPRNPTKRTQKEMEKMQSMMDGIDKQGRFKKLLS